MPSVAAIIIGDEILTGKFADENGPFLIRRLRELGADLERLVTISDEVAVIADEVRRCAASYDRVITTGGVGPTHDDRTFEGIAAAFGVGLVERPELVELLRSYDLPLTEASLRMARVPEGTELLWGEGASFPIVCVRGVHVFPGVPKLLQAKFAGIAERFAGERMLTERLYTPQRETEIAPVLGAVASEEPSVAIGSYPRFGEGAYRVIVTLESRDRDALRRAHDRLAAKLHTVSPGPAE